MSLFNCLASGLSNGYFNNANVSANPCTPMPIGLCLLFDNSASGIG